MTYVNVAKSGELVFRRCFSSSTIFFVLSLVFKKLSNENGHDLSYPEKMYLAVQSPI